MFMLTEDIKHKQLFCNLLHMEKHYKPHVSRCSLKLLVFLHKM